MNSSDFDDFFVNQNEFDFKVGNSTGGGGLLDDYGIGISLLIIFGTTLVFALIPIGIFWYDTSMQ